MPASAGSTDQQSTGIGAYMRLSAPTVLYMQKDYW